jgi:hypothetical protein
MCPSLMFEVSENRLLQPCQVRHRLPEYLGGAVSPGCNQGLCVASIGRLRGAATVRTFDARSVCDG